MGSHCVLHAFDFAKHRNEVVPALCQLFAQGSANPELSGLLAEHYQQALKQEQQFSDFYERHPKASLWLQQLQAGLGIELASVCEWMDTDLGTAHQSAADLKDKLQSTRGGCLSEHCTAREKCPFRRYSGPESYATTTMRVFQEMVMSSCENASLPSLQLLRSFSLRGVVDWYGYELGTQEDAADQAFFAAQDVLPLLLARLFRRGSTWGDRGGGSGEGLLGWLSPAESQQLAAALAAYDLTAKAAVPEGAWDHFVRDTLLPELRQQMADVRDFAQACADQQLGILMECV